MFALIAMFFGILFTGFVLARVFEFAVDDEGIRMWWRLTPRRSAKLEEAARSREWAKALEQARFEVEAIDPSTSYPGDDFDPEPDAEPVSIDRIDTGRPPVRSSESSRLTLQDIAVGAWENVRRRHPESFCLVCNEWAEGAGSHAHWVNSLDCRCEACYAKTRTSVALDKTRSVC